MEKVASNSPEKRDGVADNARKFIVQPLDKDFIDGHTVTKFRLITDWLKTGENDETKVACKQFADGREELLLIEKVTDGGGNRIAQKTPIGRDEYERQLQNAVIHVEKDRTEWQDGDLTFKYDEFADESGLRLLEVDAQDEATRNGFDVTAFPVKLAEVSGDRSYEGYRVAEHLSDRA